MRELSLYIGGSAELTPTEGHVMVPGTRPNDDYHASYRLTNERRTNERWTGTATKKQQADGNDDDIPGSGTGPRVNFKFFRQFHLQLIH
jgi:hypothetical protein